MHVVYRRISITKRSEKHDNLVETISNFGNTFLKKVLLHIQAKRLAWINLIETAPDLETYFMHKSPYQKYHHGEILKCTLFVNYTH